MALTVPQGIVETMSLAPTETFPPSFRNVSSRSVSVFWALPASTNGLVSHYILRITALNFLDEVTINAGVVGPRFRLTILSLAKSARSLPIFNSSHALPPGLN